MIARGLGNDRPSFTTAHRGRQRKIHAYIPRKIFP